MHLFVMILCDSGGCNVWKLSTQ